MSLCIQLCPLQRSNITSGNMCDQRPFFSHDVELNNKGILLYIYKLLLSIICVAQVVEHSLAYTFKLCLLLHLVPSGKHQTGLFTVTHVLATILVSFVQLSLHTSFHNLSCHIQNESHLCLPSIKLLREVITTYLNA